MEEVGFESMILGSARAGMLSKRVPSVSAGRPRDLTCSTIVELSVSLMRRSSSEGSMRLEIRRRSVVTNIGAPYVQAGASFSYT